VLAVIEAVEYGGDDGQCELGDPFRTVLEAVDEGGHDLEAGDLAREVIGLEVLVSEEGEDFIDLVQSSSFRVLGNDDLDVPPGRLALLLVPRSIARYLSIRFLRMFGGNSNSPPYCIIITHIRHDMHTISIPKNEKRYDRMREDLEEGFNNGGKIIFGRLRRHID
jgi:hypothetical protein